MTANACEKCRHLKAEKIKVPEGERVNKRGIRLICLERRMNVTSKVFVHCSKFQGRQGRPAKK